MKRLFLCAFVITLLGAAPAQAYHGAKGQKVVAGGTGTVSYAAQVCGDAWSLTVTHSNGWSGGDTVSGSFTGLAKTAPLSMFYPVSLPSSVLFFQYSGTVTLELQNGTFSLLLDPKQGKVTNNFGVSRDFPIADRLTLDQPLTEADCPHTDGDDYVSGWVPVDWGDNPPFTGNEDFIEIQWDTPVKPNRKGEIPVGDLACPAGTCKATTTVRRGASGSGSRIAAVTTLGKYVTKIPGGTKRRVKARLSKSGLALLKKKKKLTATFTLRYAQPGRKDIVLRRVHQIKRR